MVAPACTSFIYKNFPEDEIFDAPANPSLLDRLQADSYRIKVNLTICDKIKNVTGMWGGISTECAREYNTMAVQTFGPSQQSLPGFDMIPLWDQRIMKVEYDTSLPNVFIRKNITETPCYPSILDVDKYVNRLGDHELGNVFWPRTVQSLYNFGAVAAFTLAAASAITFVIYKLYQQRVGTQNQKYIQAQNVETELTVEESEVLGNTESVTTVFPHFEPKEELTEAEPPKKELTEAEPPKKELTKQELEWEDIRKEQEITRRLLKQIKKIPIK